MSLTRKGFRLIQTGLRLKNNALNLKVQLRTINTCLTLYIRKLILIFNNQKQTNYENFTIHPAGIFSFKPGWTKPEWYQVGVK